MATVDQLRKTLQRIDGRGYKAYKDIQGSYDLGECTVAVDHVQGDPFAAPSRLRVIFNRRDLTLPSTDSRRRRVALEDYLSRRVRDELRSTKRSGGGSGKSGQMLIDAGGQKIIERTACRVTEDVVEIRVSVGLPARGRSVLGRVAEELLTRQLPQASIRACTRFEMQEANTFIQTVENASALREELAQRGLVAFVADGAVLPRESGVSDRPLRGEVVRFSSPESMRIELQRPYGGPLQGMGIPEGVTIIVGGGFHGKSTLLDALAHGVYDHIPVDGRELVVTRHDAVKIRAEDGRSVIGNDLSSFIGRLPLGRSTDDFSSENASGSTSQAANILESLEAGSRLLLMDEDTCATNFMIRDVTMRLLVPDAAEPITPFIDRVRQLYEQDGVSTVLVMGGSGDYFSTADTVIWMNEYEPHDVTERARSLAGESRPKPERPWRGPVQRAPVKGSVDPTRRDRTKVRARGTEEVEFGNEQIDLRQVEQIVDASQTRGIAELLTYAVRDDIVDGESTVSAILDALHETILDRGIDAISAKRGHPGDYALPRRYEVAAAINRLRGLKVRQVTGVRLNQTGAR